MLKGILVIVLILSVSLTDAQNADWAAATNWKLFQIFTPGSRIMTEDSLSKYPSVSLDSDSLREFLSNVALLPKDKTIRTVWMGAYWVTCQLGSSKKILKISAYGGFFLDQTPNIYYELPLQQRQAWLAYFRMQFMRLQQKSGNNGAG